MSSFITINPTAGTPNTGEVTLTFEQNDGRMPRKNYVRFKTKNGAQDITEVIQAGRPEFIDVSDDLNFNIPGAGGSIVVSGYTNTRGFQIEHNGKIEYIEEFNERVRLGDNEETIVSGETYDKCQNDELGQKDKFKFEITRRIGENPYNDLSAETYFNLYTYNGVKTTVSYEIAAGTGEVSYNKTVYVSAIASGITDTDTYFSIEPSFPENGYTIGESVINFTAHTVEYNNAYDLSKNDMVHIQTDTGQEIDVPYTGWRNYGISMDSRENGTGVDVPVVIDTTAQGWKNLNINSTASLSFVFEPYNRFSGIELAFNNYTEDTLELENGTMISYNGNTTGKIAEIADSITCWGDGINSNND